MKNTRKLVFMALFIAMEIVLTRVVSFMPSTITRISLSFIVYAFAGSMFGPIFGALSAGVGDLVGAVLFPPPGGFMIGFTLSAIVTGFIFGFIKLRKGHLKRLILVLLATTLIVDLGMTTLWVQILSKVPYTTLLISRIPGILINLGLRFTILYILMQRTVQGDLYEDRHSNRSKY